MGTDGTFFLIFLLAYALCVNGKLRSNSFIDSKQNKRRFLNATEPGDELRLNLNCEIPAIESRVIYGESAELGEFPWMALLGYKRRGLPFLEFICGGSLITKRYVLTAAHCLFQPGYKLRVARLGEHNVDTEKDCRLIGKKKKCSKHYRQLRVEKQIRYPHFKEVNSALKNDIGLVRLIKKPFEYYEYISPICLPIGKNYTKDDYTNHTFKIAGWGQIVSDDSQDLHPILQQADVMVWSQKRCNGALPPLLRPLKEGQLCAIGPKGRDACKGDSGGPLMNITRVGDSLHVVQVGIISQGATVFCGFEDIPTVYTRVEKYIDWIQKIVNRDL